MIIENDNKYTDCPNYQLIEELFNYIQLYRIRWTNGKYDDKLIEAIYNHLLAWIAFDTYTPMDYHMSLLAPKYVEEWN